MHRRGLAALDRFLLTVLAPSQGLEAAQWLSGQLGLVQQEPAVATPAPLAIEEVRIDEQELAALETEFAASPELAELSEPPRSESLVGQREQPVAAERPALFGRMKALLRQCLEDAIVGVDDDEDPDEQAPAFSAPVAAPQAQVMPEPAPVVPAEPAAPRLSLVPPVQASTTPAPAPASLAALRAWLPDAEEDGRDLPRAC